MPGVIPPRVLQTRCHRGSAIVVRGRVRLALIDTHSSDRTKTDASTRHSVGPMAQGANSSSPTPWASLFVFSPPATATIFSKIWRPTSSTGTPSRITPALISISSTIRSYMGVLVATLIEGDGLHPKQLPRPVVKTTTLHPPATSPVTETGSYPGVSMITNPLLRIGSAK